MKTTLISILILMALTPAVLGLGISPGKTIIQFEPNLNQTYSFKLLDAGNASVGVAGELAQYITIETKAPVVRFRVSLPPTLELGVHEARIVVSEPVSFKGIGAQIVLNHMVIVDVPPRFARIIAEVNGTPGELVAKLTNPKDKAAGIRFAIELSDKGDRVFKFEKRGISLGANTTTLLKIPLNFSRKGGFEANYTINVDQESIRYKFPIQLGSRTPKIKMLPAKLNANEVNPITLAVENDWNSKLSAHVKSFLSQQGKQLWAAESQEFKVSEYNTTNQQIFIDATKAVPGSAELVLELWYGHNKIEIKREIGLYKQEPVIKKEKVWPAIIGMLAVLGMMVGLLWVIRSNRAKNI